MIFFVVSPVLRLTELDHFLFHLIIRCVVTFLLVMHCVQDLDILPSVKLPYLGGPVVMSFPKNLSI